MNSPVDLPQTPGLAFQRSLSAWNARLLGAAMRGGGAHPPQPGDGDRRRIPSHPWPTFVDTGTLGSWAALALALRRLVATAGRAAIGGDPRRIATLFGYSIERASLVARLLSTCEPDELFASRADFLLTPDGLRCCELDFGDVGLWHVIAFNAMFPHTALAAEVVARNRIPVRERHPVDLMVRELLKLVGRSGPVGACNLAILVADDMPDALFDADREETAQASALYAAALRALGVEGRILLARASGLRVGADGASVGACPVQAVLTQTPTLADEDRIWSTTSLLRLVECKAVVVLNGPHCYALSNKIVFALLSEAADSGMLEDDDAALVRAAIPWTRRVRRHETGFRSASHWLPELLAAHKDAFVLKPSEGFASHGVTIGRCTGQADWERALALALDEGTWVTQALVGGVPMWFPADDGQLVPHGVNLGIVGCGAAYVDAFLRIKPLAAAGEVPVIGYGHGALTAGILEVDGD